MAVCDNADVILSLLQKRNNHQCQSFANIINAHSKLFDNVELYKTENLQLNVEINRLRNGGTNGGPPNSPGYAVESTRIKTLEQKLQEKEVELLDLHKTHGANAQEIIDKNNILRDYEKKLAEKDNKIVELQKTVYDLQDLKQSMEETVADLVLSNDTLTDEHAALQLAYASIEKGMRMLQDENRELVERWMKRKSQDADRLNAENDALLRKKEAKIRKELTAAVEEPMPVLAMPTGPSYATFGVSIPSKASDKQDAHEGEVNAVKWGQTGSMFATGGADRKIHIWDVVNGTCKRRTTLAGSSGVIMCLEFEPNEGLLLAGSGDHACRLWSINDQRIKHTLTGHAGKVLAAKFLNDPTKVVSASYDRTMKIWDLRSRACSKTMFAGSKCNDLVVWGNMDSSIITGHFDKTVKFWDIRKDTPSTQISLQGRVTSLDISPDQNTLLVCNRDDTLRLIDLRQSQVITTLSQEGFRVPSDNSHAVFSPDGQYVMAGGSDAGLYIWNVAKKKIEKVLTSKAHAHPILSCSWSPLGNSLLSCDKQHKVVLWADY